MMFGAVEVLVPLRVDDLGGGHALIAAGFIVGAAHRGLARAARRALLGPGRPPHPVRRRPHASAAVAMVAIGVGAGARASCSAGFLVSSLGGGICFAPALTMLSETAESSRLHQGFAAGLSNMAWASGQVTGGLAGGGIASIAGYAAPEHRDRRAAALHRRLRPQRTLTFAGPSAGGRLAG